MIRVIFNQKGGVGKSSITTNLAAISANAGLKTLLIDLDPQCNSSQYLLGELGVEYENTVAHFFEQCLRASFRNQNAGEIPVETGYENLHLISSHSELSDLQSKLESRHKIYKFRDLLADLSEIYDRIYIDTPPAFNFFTLSALIGADAVFVPFDCDQFSRNALYNLIENLNETRDDHNSDLKLGGIIINQFQPRANQAKRIVEALTTEELPVLDAKLGTSVIMRESHEVSKPLIHFAPKHKLTQQYVELFNLLEPDAA